MATVGLVLLSSFETSYTSQAHPVGQGVAELRTEAEALRLGLQAVLDLQDYSTFQGIRVLTDSYSTFIGIRLIILTTTQYATNII